MIKKSLIYILFIFTAFIISIDSVKAETTVTGCSFKTFSWDETGFLRRTVTYTSQLFSCDTASACILSCKGSCGAGNAYLNSSFVIDFCNNYKESEKCKVSIQNALGNTFGCMYSYRNGHPEDMIKDGVIFEDQNGNQQNINDMEQEVIDARNDEVIGWGKIPLKRGLFLITDNKCTVGKDCPSCEELISEKGGDLLQTIFNVLKILAVVALFGLTTMDFVKGITSDDENYYKKAFVNLGKRAVVVIVIFLLPSLIKLIMAFIGIQNGSCGIE